MKNKTAFITISVLSCSACLALITVAVLFGTGTFGITANIKNVIACFYSLVIKNILQVFLYTGAPAKNRRTKKAISRIK